MDAVQVYDVVLDAALQTQKCGPQKLLVTDEWEWLLHGFAGRLTAAKLQQSELFTYKLAETPNVNQYGDTAVVAEPCLL